MPNPYKEMAEYYDLLYTWKNYKKEARKLKRLIKRYKKSTGSKMLEVACGTAKHAALLKKDFSIVATDFNKSMLDLARKNVKGVTFQHADMVNLKLGKKFDVILCLFSSIGYVKTAARLKKTLRNFAAHLKPGGIVIIEPWFSKSAFKPWNIHLLTVNKERLKIVRLTDSFARGNISYLDMHYLIGKRGKKIKSCFERHELGLFEVKETLRYMKQAGLRAKFVKKGLMKDRGLYLGIKK